MQEFPVAQKFCMMNFRPCLDEALLRPREPAANALDRIESERRQGVLIQGVEVRPMVRGTDFHEHPNDSSGTAVLYIVRLDVVGPTVRMSRARHERPRAGSIRGVDGWAFLADSRAASPALR